ncbi:MAG: hypothetical protein HOP16_05765 [Acidobacteria bacterium]|nr:hypothetical protein [Acidobacteriota bacterium]
MSRQISAGVLTFALAAPGLVLIVATAFMLAGLPFGADPLWAVEPLTLAEAAALRDNGEVVRLIDTGSDVNATSAVRADVFSDHALQMTPLEAAVAGERADMVELLFDQGARPDATQWTRLMCFASSVEADDVRALLEPRRPDGASESCDGVAIGW